MDNIDILVVRNKVNIYKLVRDNDGLFWQLVAYHFGDDPINLPELKSHSVQYPNSSSTRKTWIQFDEQHLDFLKEEGEKC